MKQAKQSNSNGMLWCVAGGILMVTLGWAIFRSSSAQTFSEVVPPGRNAQAQPDAPTGLPSTTAPTASLPSYHP